MNIETKYDIMPPVGRAHLIPRVWFMYENKALQGRIIEVNTSSIWYENKLNTPTTLINYTIVYNGEKVTVKESDVFETKEQLILSL